MKQREVGEAYEASTSALEAAKGQRLSLRRAIAALEEALAITDDPDTKDLNPTMKLLDEILAGKK